LEAENPDMTDSLFQDNISERFSHTLQLKQSPGGRLQNCTEKERKWPMLCDVSQNNSTKHVHGVGLGEQHFPKNVVLNFLFVLLL